MRGQPLAFLAALAACCACDRVPESAITTCQSDVRMVPARTDILVVVDDSLSMAEEQENLRQNLAVFVEALSGSPIPHEFQIGVTNTSVHATQGMSAQYPYWLPPYDGARIPYPRGTLVAVDPGALTDPDLRGLLLYDPDAARFTGSRVLSFDSATLVQDFEANVLVGVQGSSKEEPLRAAELALTERIADGANVDGARPFLRSGARLGVIVLTDEDDCSERAEPLVATTNAACHDPETKGRLLSLTDFAAFLQGPIAGELRDPVLAVIAGFDPDTLAPTGCATSYDDPTRLDALVEAMGPARAFRGSICDASFGPSLQRIADLLVPQTVAIDGAPADHRMLLAGIRRGAARVACPVARTGDGDAAGAGAVYAPPQEGRPPTLTFQGPCRLQPGDRVELAVVCAG